MDSIVFPDLPTYLGEPNLAGFLSLGLTIILPVLAALLMRSSWPAFRKGLVLLALAAVKAYLEAWIGAVNSVEQFNAVATVYSTFVQWGIAVLAYVGLLKNTAVARAALNGGIVHDRVGDGAAG